MANNFFGAVGISGGSDGYLDNIDGGNLADGDGALVINTATNQGTVFVLDADSATAQVVPTIIQPDANAGDRRWLMRGWEGTEYSLYEPGTVNLMTWKMSSGNVIFDHTYDTGTLTFKGENTGDSTMLVMDPAGAVDLYYAGSKKLETVTGGVTVTGALTATSLVGTVNIDLSTSTLTGTLAEFNTALSDENFVSIGGTETLTSKTLTSPIINTIQTAAGKSGIINIEDGAVTLLYSEGTRFATSSSGATVTGALTTTGAVITNLIETAAGKTGATFTEDGATALYNNEVKTLYTRSNGMQYGDGTNESAFFNSGASLFWDSFIHGAAFNIRGENASGTAKTIFVGDPDGAAELYYAGTKKFETNASGVSIGLCTQTFVSERFFIDNYSVSGEVLVRGNDSASSLKTIIQGDPDGAVDLYHAGSKALETLSNGISIANAGTASTWIYSSNNEQRIKSIVAGEPLVLKGENLSNSSRSLFKGDPDGAAELYYAGVVSACTNAAGLIVKDTSGASPVLTFQDDAGTDHSRIVSAATETHIKLWDGVSAFETGWQSNLNSSTDLYYAGVKHFSTIDDGIEITVAGGCLTIPEITTPTADANKGKVYCKADNKLYFQDGAGTEYEIATV